MGSERGRILSTLDVAEIWFGTRSPSADQLRKVLARMQSGALVLNDPAAPPARWTTTEQALAKFLAARRASKDAFRQAGGPSAHPTSEAAATTIADAHLLHHKNAVLRGVYRTVWRDYFLAVMVRRRVPRASKSFERAVIAGQLTAVAIIGMMVAGALGAWSPARPVEERLIGDHLTGQHGWHQVEQWHPRQTNDDGRRVVRVEYRYRDGASSRVVHTDRSFVVGPDGVTEVSSEEGN